MNRQYGYKLNIERDSFGDRYINSIYFFDIKTNKLCAIFDFEESIMGSGGIYIDFDIEIQKFQN